MSEELFEGMDAVSEQERAEVINGIEALDKQERRLQSLPTHGVRLGVVEFEDMRRNAQEILDFVDTAPRVLNLNSDQESVFYEMVSEYISGEMTRTRLMEFKKVFFVPYMRRKHQKMTH